MPCFNNKSGNPDQIAQQAGFPILETDLAMLQQIAAKAPKQSKGTPTPFRTAYVLACLKAHAIIWCKKTANDCGSVSAPTSGSTAQKALSTGLTAAGGFASVGATGLLGGSAAAGTGIAGFSATLGTVTMGVGLLALPLAIIWGRHAQKVRTEEETMCAVSQGYAQFMATVEVAIREKQINLEQARQYALQMNSQIASLLQPIANDKCNAACLAMEACDALTVFCVEVLFPRYVSSYSVAGVTVGKNTAVLALGALAVAAVVLKGN